MPIISLRASFSILPFCTRRSVTRLDDADGLVDAGRVDVVEVRDVARAGRDLRDALAHRPGAHDEHPADRRCVHHGNGVAHGARLTGDAPAPARVAGCAGAPLAGSPLRAGDLLGMAVGRTRLDGRARGRGPAGRAAGPALRRLRRRRAALRRASRRRGSASRLARKTTAAPVKRATPRSGNQPGVRGSSAGSDLHRLAGEGLVRRAAWRVRVGGGAHGGEGCRKSAAKSRTTSRRGFYQRLRKVPPPPSTGSRREVKNTRTVPTSARAPVRVNGTVRVSPLRRSVSAPLDRGARVAAGGPGDLEHVAALREADDLQRLAAGARDVARDDGRLGRRPEPGDAPPLRVDEGEVEVRAARPARPVICTSPWAVGSAAGARRGAVSSASRTLSVVSSRSAAARLTIPRARAQVIGGGHELGLGGGHVGERDAVLAGERGVARGLPEVGEARLDGAVVGAHVGEAAEDAHGALAIALPRGEIGARLERVGVERVAARPPGRQLLRLADAARGGVEREELHRPVAAVRRGGERALRDGELGGVLREEGVGGVEAHVAIEDPAHGDEAPAAGEVPRSRRGVAAPLRAAEGATPAILAGGGGASAAFSSMATSRLGTAGIGAGGHRRGPPSGRPSPRARRAACAIALPRSPS